MTAVTLNPGSTRPVTYLDATPDMIHVPSSACRVAATYPNAKLVVVLRDPVSRAFSAWNMRRGKKGDKVLVPFDESVRGQRGVV
jgi:hypothetical protein